MPISLNVIVVHEGDPQHLKLPPETIVDLGALDVTMLVIENGMDSGLPSVALVIPTPDGHNLVGETSLALFIAALSVMRGAFPDSFADSPFAGGVAPVGLADTPGSN